MKTSPFSDEKKDEKNKFLTIQTGLVKHIERSWAKKSGRMAEETAKALLSFERARYQIKILRKFIPLKGKKLLEIGSGYSIFLSLARKEFDVEAYGIEPASWGLYDNALKMGKKILSINGVSSKYLIQGTGEKIPFLDETFDIVYSHYVLEHVPDERKILQESIRVLKKGGHLFFVFPNYNSFWEGHYGIFWAPFLNKSLAKIYVRLLGKNPSIINDLNFVNKRSIEKSLNNFSNLEVVTWGEKLFEESLQSLSFPEDGTMGSAKKILKVLARLKLTKIITHLAEILDIYTPIVLVVKKLK